MSTQQVQQRHSGQTGASLRMRAADFFKMDVPQATFKAPARDCNPLRRPVKRLQDMDAWETNENMCVALWELMSRS